MLVWVHPARPALNAALLWRCHCTPPLPPPTPTPPQIGVIYGNPEVTSGGQALKYYASVRCGLGILSCVAPLA